MPSPRNPIPTVDIIIELESGGIVLIRRKNPPPGWALPGGFVDYGESLETAAIREAREETCLDVELQCLLGCYSDPGRDQRMHTVSAVYIAKAHGEPRAADDAKHLAVFIPAQIDVPLAFDHRLIIDDYLHYKKTGTLPAPRS